MDVSCEITNNLEGTGPLSLCVYDLSWLPVAVGLLVGLLVFWLSEKERRSYLARAGGAKEK